MRPAEHLADVGEAAIDAALVARQQPLLLELPASAGAGSGPVHRHLARLQRSPCSLFDHVWRAFSVLKTVGSGGPQDSLVVRVFCVAVLRVFCFSMFFIIFK